MNSPGNSMADSQHETLEATIEGRQISVGVAAGKVEWARHSGAADGIESTILQRVCDEMVGHSLREAAEHSAIYAADKLVRDGSLKPAAGISLPRSMGREIDRAEAITRMIYRKSSFREKDPGVWNFEDRGPSVKWTSRAKQDRLVELRGLWTKFFNSHAIVEGAISIVEIDRYERIDVQFGDAVAVSEKPGMLMNFEKFLRDSTGERLEVFVSEMKDLNRIRRL